MRATPPNARMIEAFRAFRPLASEIRSLEFPRRAPFRCRVLRGPDAIARAKQLQGQAYVRYGYVPANRLTPEGWVPWHQDPPPDRGRWFGTFGAGGELVAAGRRIVSDRTGPGSLPAVRLMGAGQIPGPLLGAPGRDRTVELTGIAKRPHAPLLATMLLYRAIYQDSVCRGDRMWVMSVAPALRTTLRLIAPGALRISSRSVALPDGDYPGVRPGVRAYSAWAGIDRLTTEIRTVADAVHSTEYRRFLRAVASFLDDRIGG